MTNIQCKGRKEIDLLAISPTSGKKYHVESSVWTSRGFYLKEKDLDYFKKERFDHPIITERIRESFGDSNYEKVLIVFNTKDNFRFLPELAEEKYGFHVWGIKSIVAYFMANRLTRGSRDDIIRTMELVSLVRQQEMVFLKKLGGIKNLRKKHRKTRT